MTASASKFFASIAAISACVACTGGGITQPPPDELQGVLGELNTGRHRAPLRGRFTIDDAVCRVPNWETLHPDEPELAWLPLTALRVEPAFVDPAVGELEGRLLFATSQDALAVDDNEGYKDIVTLIAPWGGEAPIACGDLPAVGGFVVGRPLITQGETRDGFTRDELVQRASENVAAQGLREIVDADLTAPDPCADEPAEAGCITFEPPEPE